MRRWLDWRPGATPQSGASRRLSRSVMVVALLATLTAVAPTAAHAQESPAAAAWNFQPADSAAPSGYAPDSGEPYSATRGYGWQIADGVTRQCGDRNLADRVRSTFCHAQRLYTQSSNGSWSNTDSPASWHADVIDGAYDVTVIVGEATNHQSWIRHSAQVEGVSFVDKAVTSSSTPFIEVTKTVTVAGASLDVTFDGGTGTKIVAVSITPSESDTAPPPPPAEASAWNFQPADSAAPSGYAPDSGEPYSATRGYGWQIVDGVTRQCGDRNLADRVRSTFCHAQRLYSQNSNGTWTNTDSPATWHADVADGSYAVTVIVGEASSHQSWIRHSVQVEGVSFVDKAVTSSSTPFIEVTKTVTVAGASLDVTFDGGSGTKIVAVSITPSESGGGDTGATTFAVWYGDDQTFGSQGIPQRFANLLGNVTDPDGIASLSYRVNGGTFAGLTVGPDLRRLQRQGDFNAEIPFTALNAGANTVTLRAVDGLGNASTKDVTVRKAAASSWPLPYTADWSSTGPIGAVAQPVDGKWAKVANGIRTSEVGYDRLLAIGDMATWQNYEATVPITVHSVDPAGYECPACGPGVGFAFRWEGHRDDGFQPRREVRPLGSLGWYRYRTTGNALIVTDSQSQPAVSDSSWVLNTGTTYQFKFRVDTNSDGSFLYRLKAWPASQAEPSTWSLQYTAPSSAPARGSLLLVAHYVDATFGTVTVTGSSSTAPESAKVFDQRLVIDGTNYNWDSNFQSPVPDLHTYVGKPASLGITVHAKASTLDTRMQVCVWRKGTDGTYKGPDSDEACSPLVGAIRHTGSYAFQLPEPSNWWAKSGKGNFDWSKGFHRIGVIVKDFDYGKPPPLLNYANCGSSCHPEGESYVKLHTPVDFGATVTFFK